MMMINLNDISVVIIQKNIKNVHLSVLPPHGSVRVSAPEAMNIETIRAFVISKISWIKKQQTKFLNQARETPRDMIERESHYFAGKRYRLKIEHSLKRDHVSLTHQYITLHTHRNPTYEEKQELLSKWYRQQLKNQIPDIIKKYEKIMQISVSDFGIKKMKTKWGTCNIQDKRIWLNLELVKKPLECLEYVIVHEMTHLIEPTHNQHFIAYMDLFLPKWRFYKDDLNKLPIGYHG